MLRQLFQYLVQHLRRGGEHGGQSIIPAHLGHLRVDIDQGIQLLGFQQGLQEVNFLVIGQILRLLERADQFGKSWKVYVKCI